MIVRGAKTTNTVLDFQYKNCRSDDISIIGGTNRTIIIVIVIIMITII